MYNVKGPSKIVAKCTRRGISQNLETLHNRSKTFDSNDNEIVNGPKLIFQNRKNANHKKIKETISPQHEELIKFIQESWIVVASELKNSQSTKDSGNNRGEQSVKYYEDTPCQQLQNFKPFDLEAWWGRRLFTIITSSVGSTNQNI